jgi:hypothetical protein
MNYPILPITQSAVPGRRVLTETVAGIATSCLALLRTAGVHHVGGSPNPDPSDQPRTPSATASQGGCEPAPSAVASLVYELLDAHDDTAQMASDLELDPLWQAHLDYLRALQRKGRETLAHMQLDHVA